MTQFKINSHKSISWSVFLFYSNGVNTTIEYILEVYSVSPLFGSLMGGTELTVSGSGFSSNVSDNTVSVGKQHVIQS